MNTVSSHCIYIFPDYASYLFHLQPLDGQCDDGPPLPEPLQGFLLHKCKVIKVPGV